MFLIFTRAKARGINSLCCFFFAQDLVSHFDQSLQIVNTCDYLRFVIGSSLVALAAHPVA